MRKILIAMATAAMVSSGAHADGHPLHTLIAKAKESNGKPFEMAMLLIDEYPKNAVIEITPTTNDLECNAVWDYSFMSKAMPTSDIFLGNHLQEPIRVSEVACSHGNGAIYRFLPYTDLEFDISDWLEIYNESQEG